MRTDDPSDVSPVSDDVACWLAQLVVPVTG